MPQSLGDNPLPDTSFLLPLSASTSEALDARVVDLGHYIQNANEIDFVSLAHTLANRRSKLSRRGYILASPATAKTDLTVGNLVSTALPGRDLVFVFTGQGAQWAEMGRQLLEKSYVYRKTIEELDNVLQSLPEAPEWSIRDALLESAPHSRVGDARFSQPLCTAVQIGLVKLLASWEIHPQMVAGHSSGEIAAAFAAGLLSEAQAIMVAYYRGYVVGQLRSQGSMMAFGGSVEDAQQLIQKLSLQEEVVVACVNSPESVTLSGSVSGIDSLLQAASQMGKFARKLQTGGKAYHSYMMQEVGEQYSRLIEAAWPALPANASEREVRFFSSVGIDGVQQQNQQDPAAELLAPEP